MRDIFSSPRIEDMKRKRKSRRIRLSILLCILFVFLFGALAYFSAHYKVTIHSIVVSGNRIINTSDIEDIIRKDIEGRYFYLFSKANVFLYPKGKIKDDIMIAFPRIDTLRITRDKVNTIRITLSERSGAFLYCGENIPETKDDVGENCYFINNEGYIFDKAPYFSGNVYFKYYLKLPLDSTNPLGTQMLSPDRFHDLVRFIDKIQDLGLDATALTIASDGTHTLILNHTPGGTTPKIIFKADNNLETIFENISTAMAKSEVAQDIKSKYATLLYIDLRFKNKVLYKFNE